MKSAIFGFVATAALLALNVVPGGWRVGAAPDANSFEARHAAENKTEVEARLGLGAA